MERPTPIVRVLIPSYAQRDVLLGCLESIQASDGPEPRVLVVDDCSPDDSVAEVRRRFPRHEVLVNARNLGFASACNAGIQVVLEQGAELILLLNQDTLVSPDMIGKLSCFMESHPDAGIVGPRTWSLNHMPDGSQRLIYAGAWRSILPLRQRIPGIEQADTEPLRDPVQADYVWGHGMMIRASALRDVGGFDPGFPMYYEDLDLCRRMREAGYEVWCEPSAVMWHDQPDGARAADSEYWRWACKVHSMSVFHRKHYGKISARLLTSLTVAAEARQLLWHRHIRATGHLVLAALRHAFGLSDPLRGRAGRGEEPL